MKRPSGSISDDSLAAVSSLAAETLLVVDDNVQNCELVEGQLGAAGYRVLCANSGEEALLCFQHQEPALILLDIMMPGMDGFETFRRLRRLPGGTETPIVFLTAAADPRTHKQALEIGADDFLCKPINRTELLIRVRSLLRVHRFQAELRSNYETICNQRDALLRVQEQKDQLMAFVVHDLNSPLTNITLLAEMLKLDSTLGENARSSVRDISSAADSLQRMVWNLLDLSRSEDGQLIPELGHVDLKALLAQICQRHQERARLRQQWLVLSCELGRQPLRGDPELLRRLFENLLDNAIKYAPPGTEIRILGSLVEGGKWVEVRVCDEGPGIAASQRERIFEKYAQLDNSGVGQVRAGRGLGLTFCKLAAEVHGGRISVECTQQRGSSFCVRLPLAGP